MIYTLSRDGKTIEILGQAIPTTVIRDIKWSLDENYIYYAYWDTIETGPAYIIDKNTKGTKEICISRGYTFLTGYWLPNNQFAYIVYKGEQDQPGVNELVLLDVKDWTAKTIFKTKTNKNQLHKLNFIGWTDLSNP